MGYHTDFQGDFELNKKLDTETYNFLVELNRTRRMARQVDSKYGIDGEFYVLGTGECGQGQDKNIIDFNKPPATQPGLWCQWIPTKDKMYIRWDGGEKFYNYIEWIKYIISKVLAPRGYILNGEVVWRGEDWNDVGAIKIKNNVVNGKRLVIDYSINRLLPLPEDTKKAENLSPKTGFKKDGTKTKHQIAKEKNEKLIESLKQEYETKMQEKDLKITELENKLEKAQPSAKKMTVKDLALDKIRITSNFDGDLNLFKAILKDLL